ncbi:transglycosylase SLT domain-containing protein [Candidatus Cardinium hertigii]|uniref:transglycosylase SLT domain-containing protein n=1 Tax=Candidatus Cardinium hertigii TaxID=247481 RepID=UPI003D7E92C8
MAISLVLLSGWSVDALEPIVVPKAMKFAGIHLKFTDGARNRIQEKVNQLTRPRKIFSEILDRTHLFFPLIEKTLAEENVPDDFKFQALHESMLIGDAVSHTHDVGFWQIHKVAALDLKLMIDHPVDERMHLIQSTKAAARFLKSHCQYFDSWLGALLAYNRGRTGAIKLFPKEYRGATVVRLNDKTDGYIIAVVATKIAFGKIAGKKKHSTYKLCVYNQGHHGQNLKDLAAHFKIEENLLSKHNQWLRTSVVPGHTKCALLVPLLHTDASMRSVLELPKPVNSVLPKDKKVVSNRRSRQGQSHRIDYAKYLQSAKIFPEVSALKDSRSSRLIKANGRRAIVAQKGDTVAYLAQLVNISIDKFLLINEIKKIDQLIPGHIYYFSPKGSKAGIHYHVVASGEDIWSIAQRYGIKQSALLEKNRMRQPEPLEKGRILWLRFIRPSKVPVEYYNLDLYSKKNGIS